MQKLKQSFLTIVIGLALAAGLSYAWTGPTANPPENNAPAPLNVSSSSQIKTGALQVNGFRNIGDATFDGSVGIGVSPIKTAKLYLKAGNNSNDPWALRIEQGVKPLKGKVLTAVDDSGNAEWVSLLNSVVPQGTLCGSAFYEIAEESNHCWNLQQNSSCNGSPIMTKCGVTVCPAGFTPARTAYSWGYGSSYDGGIYRYYNMSCSKI